MKNTKLKNLIRNVYLWAVLGFLLLPSRAHAWEVETVFGIKVSGGAGGTPLNDLIGQVLNLLYGIAGSLAVLMLIFGGFRYITSGGNSKLAQEAKETIQSAFMGLVLVLLAFMIAQFLENTLGIGAAITNPAV